MSFYIGLYLFIGAVITLTYDTLCFLLGHNKLSLFESIKIILFWPIIIFILITIYLED
jgi:lipopolysaccharide export LptBFGC system permease protein LptF